MTEVGLSRLKAAGWNPGRRVDSAPAESALASAGYTIWPALSAFLEEYQGLTIWRPDDQSPLWIDSTEAARAVDPEWTSAYEKLSRCALAPIGGYSHMDLFFGRDKGLYGGFDVEFGRLGGSVEELVACVLYREPPAILSMVVED